MTYLHEAVLVFSQHPVSIVVPVTNRQTKGKIVCLIVVISNPSFKFFQNNNHKVFLFNFLLFLLSTREVHHHKIQNVIRISFSKYRFRLIRKWDVPFYNFFPLVISFKKNFSYVRRNTETKTI